MKISKSQNFYNSWKGKECPQDLRKKILVELDAFLAKIDFKGRPSIESLNAGIETQQFKQMFSNWKDPEKTVGIGKAYVENSVAKSVKGRLLFLNIVLFLYTES